jgi:hypothetical protein
VGAVTPLAAAGLAALVGALPGPLATGVTTVGSYAGVACHTPNSVACDRIGLAVRLRPRPARVTAVVGADRIMLAPHGGRRQWIGYVRGAGLRGRGPLAVRRRCGSLYWAGADAPLVYARVVATLADGRREITTLATPLRPGFG